MSKMGLFGTSLVAALPAGLLTYIALMAVLNDLEKMPSLFKAVLIATLVLAAVVALFPGYILIWYGPKTPKAPKAAKADKTAEKQVASSSAEALMDGGDEDSGSGVVLFGPEDSADASGDSISFEMSADEEEFEFEEFDEEDK